MSTELEPRATQLRRRQLERAGDANSSSDSTDTRCLTCT